MLCCEVLGNLGDHGFAAGLGDFDVDHADIDWHEAFKKLHRKTSEQGREVGIRLGDWVLSRGLSGAHAVELTVAERVLGPARRVSASGHHHPHGEGHHHGEGGHGHDHGSEAGAAALSHGRCHDHDHGPSSHGCCHGHDHHGE